MRLYFDECCSRRLPKELKEFYAADYPDLETCHVLDFYDAGTGDSHWLKPLQENKLWIVITKDHGRNAKKEKLPVVCKQFGITHIAMSPTIINAGYSVHKNALVSVWEQLSELYKLPPGTQVKLCIGTMKGDVKRFELRVGGKLLSSVLISN
jgi:hypothetical protein